ncbi:major capsid protein [Massilia sp. CT11-108]|uniref:major capsid protein n=1 Tax=Massilia sp. CT11-108 TaxID=3393900 RepID=UPI0039A6A0A7
MKLGNLKKAAAAALGVAAMAVSSFASAAVDISADTTSAKTDIATAGGLIIGVVVSIAVVGWIRRVVR